MKKFLYSFIMPMFVFLSVLDSNLLLAQVTFTEPDSGYNFGITAPGNLMGFAWGDYDSDGDLDFLMTAGPSTLYRNDISDSMRFVQVSSDTEGGEGILYDASGNPLSALWGDFNGDGKLDLSIGTLRIYINSDTGFAFQEDLLAPFAPNNVWGSTAADYDRDGDLDLAVATGTATSDGAGPPLVFRNEGDGTFTYISDELGIPEFNVECWNPQFVDMNNDGYMDLWLPTIRTPGEPVAILTNDQGEVFDYLPGSESGVDATQSITSAWGDFDNDGYMDLFSIPHNEGTTHLYRNNGDFTFTDFAPDFGLDSAYANARGAAWGDYDNDGDQDLLINRGGSGDGRPTELWKNNLVEDGVVSFTEVGEEAGVALTDFDRRTIAFVDYNNDGWLDIFVKHNAADTPRLFRNEGGNGNHWIAFRPKGIDANTPAIGARFKVVAGDLTMYRDVREGGGANGYGMFPNFGLGSATTIDTLIVNWPSGEPAVEYWTDVTVDSYNDIVQGTGTVVGIKEHLGKNIPDTYQLYQNYPNPFNPTTTIAFNLPVRNEIRLLLINSLGEVVKEVATGNYDAGLHEVKLDASEFASGVYFYRFEAGNFVTTKKLILMK